MRLVGIPRGGRCGNEYDKDNDSYGRDTRPVVLDLDIFYNRREKLERIKGVGCH